MNSGWNTDADLVELKSGVTRVLVDPVMGGSVVCYESERRGQVQPWLQPRGEGCPGTFPLVPFASRIRNGEFQYKGQTVRLVANNIPERHAIHGHGWQSEWTVMRQTKTLVELEFEYIARDWPWSYVARQIIQLQDTVLEIWIEVANRHLDAMPVGFGIHPYFPLTQECRMDTQVSHEWLLDEELMPKRRIVCGDRFATGIKPAKERLDNVYDGWDGVVRIEWPETNHCLTMTADSVFGRLVAYSPGQNYFCAEPISNIPDAFNMMSRGEKNHGVIVIEPGQQLRGCVRFSPGSIDPSESS
ncbi:MAG: hypothetical protein GKR90_02390 [Pseudomonadales bacterium]|nr:hypothetical protein [Pseudomonadales bacterium]